jgi:hypothetical protein
MDSLPPDNHWDADLLMSSSIPGRWRKATIHQPGDLPSQFVHASGGVPWGNSELKTASAVPNVRRNFAGLLAPGQRVESR